jgi:imidazolonepropionase
LGIVVAGAVSASGGQITYIGPQEALPPGCDAVHKVDCAGCWITPCLIDCHTHPIFAGNCAHEVEMRLAGVSYEDITRADSGILSTVRATRAASEDELVASALPRLDHVLREGVTTAEVKSGSGLDLETEIRTPRAAQRLASVRNDSISTTFFGAHALPPEAGGSKDSFIDRICTEILPAVAREGLADAVDGFCEGIAFMPNQVAQVFEAAKAAGLALKLHADQFPNLNGAKLAAEHGVLSAEHLEHTDENGAAAMARSGTVAVLLLGPFYRLREKQVPPVELFCAYGTRIALAMDCNPGTSPLTSLLLTMNMGAIFFRLTVHECIAGVAREAVPALDRLQDIGTLELGKWCDLAIWDIEQPAELVNRIGFNPLHTRIWRGR